MSHPTVIAMLATDRHTELLREAEAYRRAARSRSVTRRTTRSPLAGLAGRLSAWSAARRAPAQVCCA